MEPSYSLFLLILTFYPTIKADENPEISWIEELNLPPYLANHVISTNDSLRQKCEADANCSLLLRQEGACFGYEEKCRRNQTIASLLQYPMCRKDLNPSVRRQFFEQADFGYLKPRVVKNHICSSSDTTLSSLSCSDQLTHCIGKNIWFNFSNLNIQKSKRYRQDVIGPGQVGGNCEVFDEKLLRSNLEHKGYLTSWSDELQHFVSRSEFKVEVSPDFCDVIFEKPTILMKLDAAVNMYHHFCDFLNLYGSLHLNQSWDQDINIVWWDTHPGGFLDQYYGVTWQAFSRNPPIELKSLDGKRVCFKNVMLPLLARQRDGGLFYNTPLVPGCSGSSMLKTFADFILHRLKIEAPKPLLDKIRIVIQTRSTPYRKMLNVQELHDSISSFSNVTVDLVDYNERLPFLDQLRITAQSDIFIGMHGAGLTHLLFLPDWAAVFEVYNCGDEGCYFDLARLRGVKYFTWKEEKINLIRTADAGVNPTSGQQHKKFANYYIDPEEFRRVVREMIEYVRRNPKFVNARRKLRRGRNLDRTLRDDGKLEL